MNQEQPSSIEPYMTLPMALVQGALDVSTITPRNPYDANMHVRNGLIPDQAGTFEMPDGTLAAYDFVYFMKTAAGRAFLLPAPKDAVCERDRTISLKDYDENGKLKLPDEWQETYKNLIGEDEFSLKAVIVLANEDGNFVKLYSEVLPSQATEWLKKEQIHKAAGSVALQFLWSTRLEITDFHAHGVLELRV